MDIKNTLQRGDLTFYICIAVVFTLPVYVHYLPPLMILWGIFWLWENKFRIGKNMFIENKASILFLLFIGFYLWQISGLFFTVSLDSGFERIFKRLSFLLFPLVLFYPSIRITKNIKLILRLFAFASFLFVIYCFVHALDKSLNIQNGEWIFNPHPPILTYENYFLSYNFSVPVHPSYLSIYIILATLISIEALFDISVSVVKKIFWCVITFVFFIALYLLSSRAGIITALLVFPIYFLIKFYQRVSKIIIILSLLILVFVFIRIAKTNDRINYSIERLSKNNMDSFIKGDIRFSIWKSAFGVIGQNLILGVGTGNASNELKKEFKKRGYTDGYYDDMNAHNQFIEILLENGLVGLIIFFGMFGYMIFVAFSERNPLYGLFILTVIIFFLFETFLNRLAGVTFFSLFSFLLIFNKHNST